MGWFIAEKTHVVIHNLRDVHSLMVLFVIGGVPGHGAAGQFSEDFTFHILFTLEVILSQYHCPLYCFARECLPLVVSRIEAVCATTFCLHAMEDVSSALTCIL